METKEIKEIKEIKEEIIKLEGRIKYLKSRLINEGEPALVQIKIGTIAEAMFNILAASGPLSLEKIGEKLIDLYPKLTITRGLTLRTLLNTQVHRHSNVFIKSDRLVHIRKNVTVQFINLSERELAIAARRRKNE
jgi:hypothetical protein